MGTGWVIGGATSLAWSLAHVFRDLAAGDLGEGGARLVLLLGLDAALFGMWAYALALGAYGSRTALAAAAAYALVWGFGRGGLTIVVCLPGAHACDWPGVTDAIHVLNLVVGGVAAWAAWREWRARKGKFQLGTFAWLVLPLVARSLAWALG